MRLGVEKKLGRRLVLMLVAVLLNDHLDEALRCRFVDMELLAVRMIPGSQRAAKNDAFTARQEHLRSATGEAIISRRIPLFVGEPHIAHAVADAGELPRSSTCFVI